MKNSEKPNLKHPDIVAWERWLESEEARECLSGNAFGVYLKNRLWRAFMSGIDYTKKNYGIDDSNTLPQ